MSVVGRNYTFPSRADGNHKNIYSFALVCRLLIQMNGGHKRTLLFLDHESLFFRGKKGGSWKKFFTPKNDRFFAKKVFAEKRAKERHFRGLNNGSLLPQLCPRSQISKSSVCLIQSHANFWYNEQKSKKAKEEEGSVFPGKVKVNRENWN